MTLSRPADILSGKGNVISTAYSNDTAPIKLKKPLRQSILFYINIYKPSDCSCNKNNIKRTIELNCHR